MFKQKARAFVLQMKQMQTGAPFLLYAAYSGY